MSISATAGIERNLIATGVFDQSSSERTAAKDQNKQRQEAVEAMDRRGKRADKSESPARVVEQKNSEMGAENESPASQVSPPDRAKDNPLPDKQKKVGKGRVEVLKRMVAQATNDQTVQKPKKAGKASPAPQIAKR